MPFAKFYTQIKLLIDFLSVLDNSEGAKSHTAYKMKNWDKILKRCK